MNAEPKKAAEQPRPSLRKALKGDFRYAAAKAGDGNQADILRRKARRAVQRQRQIDDVGLLGHRGGEQPCRAFHAACRAENELNKSHGLRAHDALANDDVAVKRGFARLHHRIRRAGAVHEGVMLHLFHARAG